MAKSIFWRGPLESRLRIASGLFLFVYVCLHFIKLGLGTISPEAADSFQAVGLFFVRNWIGTMLLYGAFLIHILCAFARIARRGTLRLPIVEWIQIVLGVLIPVFLIVHMVFTRLGHEYFDVQDKVGFVSGLIWGSRSGWEQGLLVVLVWVHGCIGIHMWLRLARWWKSAQPWAIGFAVFLPLWALAGFMTEGRRVRALLSDPETSAEVRALYNWPDREAFGWLLSVSETGLNIFLACIAVVLLALGARTLHARRNSVRISYTDGPNVSAPRGLTLLEVSRSRGVPHTALCGGRGRCTTCRVIVEDGAENLPPPSPEEKAALEAVKAPANARLACQVRPRGDIAVFRAFRPDGRRARAHATQGSEARLAVLFLDMRGFTSRTAGQLPYDVVFLLNRFFDAIVPAIRTSGGTVDKYLGDGLLAVFEDQDPETSARAGLQAVRGISEALAEFNTQLRKEGAPEVAIGVGLHLGTVVLGEIGARGAAPRTIIGDTVNTASRLEARTKELGVQALISEPVLRAAGVEAGELSLQSLELRGVAEPLRALLMKDGREVHDLLAETA